MEHSGSNPLIGMQFEYEICCVLLDGVAAPEYTRGAQPIRERKESSHG
jgi:hypothetical protein